MTGKKQKNPPKTRRFENGAELEPLDLKKRFADLGLRRDFGLISKTEHQREERALEILNLVKSRIKSECFIVRTENLLLDFFHEKLEEIESTADESGCRRGGDFEFEFKAEVLKLTEDWIDGGTALMTTGWEVAEGRSLYVNEMEKAGKWRSFAGEKEELASELEAEVWISLLHELLIDLC